VVETAARRLTLRAAIACVAAYMLVLHSMLAGAILASQDPSPALAPFFPICRAASDAGDTTPDAPNQQQHDHSYCTLCGAGHSGLALPTGIKQPHRGPERGGRSLQRSEASAVRGEPDVPLPSQYRRPLTLSRHCGRLAGALGCGVNCSRVQLQHMGDRFRGADHVLACFVEDYDIGLYFYFENCRSV
jgi:hypothetical protein